MNQVETLVQRVNELDRRLQALENKNSNNASNQDQESFDQQLNGFDRRLKRLENANTNETASPLIDVDDPLQF